MRASTIAASAAVSLAGACALLTGCGAPHGKPPVGALRGSTATANHGTCTLLDPDSIGHALGGSADKGNPDALNPADDRCDWRVRGSKLGSDVRLILFRPPKSAALTPGPRQSKPDRARATRVGADPAVYYPATKTLIFKAHDAPMGIQVLAPRGEVGPQAWPLLTALTALAEDVATAAR